MRPLWKGAIRFGLVNIPIRLYSASLTRELRFKLLHQKDLSEIRYARICKKEEKEIPWEQIVKGYKSGDGEYVIMTDEDFRKALPEKTGGIEILDFTDENQIDVMYYDTPYYLEPEKGAGPAYALLYEALKRTKKVAVGRFVFHNHEHIGVIRVHQGILVLHQLRYRQEIRSTEELKIPKSPISKTELAMAVRLIEELSKPFHPEDYADTYTESIKKILKKKGKGEKIATKTKETRAPKVQDILSLLQESLEPKKRKSKKGKAA